MRHLSSAAPSRTRGRLLVSTAALTAVAVGGIGLVVGHLTATSPNSAVGDTPSSSTQTCTATAVEDATAPGPRAVVVGVPVGFAAGTGCESLGFF